MDAPITFETSYKWMLSIGTLIVLTGGSILIYSILFNKEKYISERAVNIPVVIAGITLFVMFLIGGFLIWKGLRGLDKVERELDKVERELTVSEVIKQELLLIEKYSKELEYNQKIKDHNQKYGTSIQEKEFRTKESIVRQALDPEFYDEVKKLIKTKKEVNKK